MTNQELIEDDMTVWLINSAVIPEGGHGEYRYEPATIEDLRRVVRRAESRIGYPATADQIQEWTGYRPAVRRDQYFLAVGDEAYVVRLRYRVADPYSKSAQRPGEGDWEIGRLTRIA